MTSPKDNIIIAERGIITQEALLAYLNDELTVEQKQQLERLLKSDPFSQDALEGLRNAQDKVAVSSSLTAIRRKVNERIGKKEKRVIPFHWSNYAYAAVILSLLISVAFILTTWFHKHNENIAMNNKESEQNMVVPQQAIKPAPPVVPPTPPTDTVLATPAVTGMVANEVITKEKDSKPEAGKKASALKEASDSTKANGSYALAAKKSLNEAKEKPSKKLDITSVAAGSAANNANNQTLAEESGATNVNKRGQMTSSPTMNNQNSLANNNASSVTQPVAAVPQLATDKDAQKTFFSGDYKKSEQQFDSVLQKEPDNSEALFFGGISDYVNGNLDQGEKKFDKLLAKKKKFMDGSKWYKANILLKKGQKDAGVNLLQELSHSNGSYKERAQKKLAEVQQ